MIYYFSGTGNSKWIAEKIAEGTGDQLINVVDVHHLLQLLATGNVQMVQAVLHTLVNVNQVNIAVFMKKASS